jgi:hypothetical protein
LIASAGQDSLHVPQAVHLSVIRYAISVLPSGKPVGRPAVRSGSRRDGLLDNTNARRGSSRPNSLGLPALFARRGPARLIGST